MADPNYKELLSILDFEHFSPPVAAAFHQSATCIGCTDVTAATCSCTRTGTYWSSTSYQSTGGAWAVSFYDGSVFLPYDKTSYHRVRAVRGGL